MSEFEQINYKIKENIQKIELFKLVNDKFSEFTITLLKNENIDLKKRLDESKINE